MRARRDQFRGRRRAFAIPIVVLLAFVAALVAALLLDLQSTSRLAIDRQVLNYKHHHTAMGIRELMDQWMLIASSNIEGQLDSNGMAFELGGPGGSSTRVYLRDGQGSALQDASGRGGDQETFAQAVSQALTAAPTLEGETLLRPAGPVQISINAAPRRVLEAVAAAAGNPGRAAAFSQEVMSRRRDKKLVDADIADSARKAGLQDAQVVAVTSMFTANTTLWWLEVVTDRGGRGDRVRQGGLVQLPPGTINLGQASITILSWDDLTDDR